MLKIWETIKEDMSKFNEVYLRSSPARDMCPEMGLLIGQALGREHNTVVIGMDYMKSSRMMRDAIVAGMLSTGTEVIDIGYVPAPVAASMAHLGDCAVYVTEYHEYGFISGYMLMTRDGGLFDRASIQALNSIISYGAPLVGSMEVGHVRVMADRINEYNRSIIEEFGRDTGCSMILDCSCGCCALSAPQILNAVGSELVTINAQRDRDFDTGRNVTIAESELRNLKHFIGNYSGYIGISLNRIGTQLDLVDEKGMDVPFVVMAVIMIQYLKPERIVLPYDADRLLVDAFNGALNLDIISPNSEKDATATDVPEVAEEPSEEEAELQEDNRLIFCEADVGEVCNAVYTSGAEIGFCDNCVIYGGECITLDGIRTSAIISQIARENNINSLSVSVARYFCESIEMEISCLPESFMDYVDQNMRHEGWTFYRFKRGWRIEVKDGWAVIKLVTDKDLSIMAGSKDRAYLIGLLDVLRDGVSRYSGD